MCISNRVGPPVKGEDFFGREKEVNNALDYLESRHSLLLSAPRRIGKSSLALKLIEEKQKAGWKCVYIDLEGVSSEQAFLELIIDAFESHKIWKQVAEGVTKGIKTLAEKIESVSVGPVDINLSSDKTYDNMYLKITNLIDHNEDTFIVVDELSLFLSVLSKTERGVERVAFLLNWLRSLRQTADSKVRWLFCGSIGLRNFTSIYKLSHSINDLAIIHIGELNDEEASGLLRELCRSKSIAMPDEIIAYALKKISWNIPYFIQVLFSKVVENYEGSITEEGIDKAYKMLCSNEHLGTWSERLDEYNQYADMARQILCMLSRVPEGMTRTSILDTLMVGRDVGEHFKIDFILSEVFSMLENDGYIITNDSVRSFQSPIIREYWFNKFAK